MNILGLFICLLFLIGGTVTAGFGGWHYHQWEDEHCYSLLHESWYEHPGTNLLYDDNSYRVTEEVLAILAPQRQREIQKGEMLCILGVIIAMGGLVGVVVSARRN